MRLFLTGDTHRFVDIGKLLDFNDEHPELTKEDIMIVLGDCGAVWKESDDQNCIKIYDDFNFTTMFVLGNHENYDLIYSMPKTRLHEGMCYEISNSLYAMQNGEIFNFNGKSFFVMGGGLSIDRQWRTPHISWWEQEIPTIYERLYALENIIKHNDNIDYILTHTPANRGIKEVFSHFLYNPNIDDYATWLDILYSISYKEWYCGHMHEDKDLMRNVHVLYNRIIEIPI